MVQPLVYVIVTHTMCNVQQYIEYTAIVPYTRYNDLFSGSARWKERC